MAPTLGSSLVLSGTTLLFKAILGLTTKSVHVEGLPILLEALREPAVIANGKGKEKERAVDIRIDQPERPRLRRGIVTVCNHNSVLDDPSTFAAMMPLSTFFPLAGPSHTSRNSRWTLGASDIMFTNPFFRNFFTLGQVTETYRGGGIFQPAVDEAVKLVQSGEWIHIFPEGKVNQLNVNPAGGLLRFKWGVGRIIMDSTVMPEIIPMWVSGFDKIMPEDRKFPRFVPRRGDRLSVTIGQPITSSIKPLVDDWRDIAAREPGTAGMGGEWTAGEGQRLERSRGDLADGQEREVRVKICDLLQDKVRELGEKVEREEGRFERGVWSQSTPGVDRRKQSA